jgi:hypothetical protein
MPSHTVDREQSAEAHLLAAAEYLAIAESSDATRAAYEHAADEIIAAQKEDPTLSNVQVGRRLKRSERWVRDLLRWRPTASDSNPSPFTRAARAAHGATNPDDSTAKKVARERPDAFVKAFEQAPPEAKRQIAQRISRAPEVRSEARRRDVEAEQQRQPSPVQPRTDHALYEFEGRLVSARRNLREALALVDGIDSPGDDEDIIELLGMLKELVAANEDAYRSGKSLDTWAWELYERSAE